MNKLIGTVCFIVKNSQVLLAEIEYPDGRIFWNGIGGVVDLGETPKQAVVREISEETGLVVNEKDVTESKTINAGNLELHIFTSNKYSGKKKIIDPTLKRLMWFDFDKLPYKQMHKDNDKWLPDVLRSAY